jgi:hypothetical protein
MYLPRKSRNNKTLQSTQKTKSKVTQNQKYAFQNPRISIGWSEINAPR